MCRVTVFLIISLTCKDGPQSKSCATDCLLSVVSMAGPQTASKFEFSLPFNWVVKCCFPPTLATSLASGYQLPAGQVSCHYLHQLHHFWHPQTVTSCPFPLSKSGLASVWLHFHECRIPRIPICDLNYLVEFSAAKNVCVCSIYVSLLRAFSVPGLRLGPEHAEESYTDKVSPSWSLLSSRRDRRWPSEESNKHTLCSEPKREKKKMLWGKTGKPNLDGREKARKASGRK